MTEKVNILVVDDQPAKLLSLETILEPLSENVLKATSADEALKKLLSHDIAVVLVDVCMPGMDGFELAQMIRDHPRFRRTAIIFISAVHLSDDDRLRGYHLGAVDYMPVPIVPDVLRAKVAIFAELYRKTELLNTSNRDLERRVAERTAELEDSNRLLRESRERVALELAAAQHLQAVSTKLIREDRVEALYEQILDAAIAIMRSDFASLQMYHPERGGELRLLAHRGFTPEAAEHWGRVTAGGDSVCGVALRNTARVIESDLSASPGIAGSPELLVYEQCGIRACQTSPLVSRSGRLVGMISTQWREPTVPGERALHLLDVLARQAADLIERSQNEQALREAQAMLAEQKAALELAISDAPLTDALSVLLQAGRRQLGVDARTVICLLDPGTNTLRIAASAGLDPEASKDLECQPVGPDCPACGLAAHLARNVLVEDVTTDPAWSSRLDVARRHRIASTWSFPVLAADGTVLGTYAAVFSSPQPHDSGLIERSTLLARTASLIIERHHQIQKRTRAEDDLRQSEAKFRTLADNMAQLAWMAEPDGSVFWLNRRWVEFTGLSHEASVGSGWTTALHPSDSPRILPAIAECFRTGAAWEETFRTRGADGAYRWFLTRAFPIRDESGTVIRWFGTGTDVTEQREAQQVLARDRETLEHLVAERTAELHRSNERLRLSQRMATIGTLSAGLGHDIGNLLLPVRMRLDALDACPLPEHAREDTEAIRKAVEYLQRLAGSLRLLALDSRSEEPADARTSLHEWWRECQGMVRNGVAHTVCLDAELPEKLPAVRIGKASLTQVVFNLVQNAGDALAGRDNGRICFSASVTPAGNVALTISDNGPGMSEETRHRCLEPFFTTKTRELSTGLGLSLVSAIVKRARGTLHVSSSEQGASFTVELPVAATPARAEAPGDAGATSSATVRLRDPRLAAHVRSTLAQLRVSLREAPGDAELWIADADDPRTLEETRAPGSPERRFVLFARPGAPRPNIPRAVWLDSSMKLSELRERLIHAIAASPEPALEPT